MWWVITKMRCSVERIHLANERQKYASSYDCEGTFGFVQWSYTSSSYVVYGACSTQKHKLASMGTQSCRVLDYDDSSLFQRVVSEFENKLRFFILLHHNKPNIYCLLPSRLYGALFWLCCVCYLSEVSLLCIKLFFYVSFFCVFFCCLKFNLLGPF